MLCVTLKHHSWEPEVEVFMYIGVGIETTACADSADTIYDKVNERFRLAIWNKEAKILIMMHTNDAQTVQTCQTRWVCKPRPPAYIWDPAWVQGPASISTTTSDPQPVYEARVVFKVRSVIEEIWHISQPLFSYTYNSMVDYTVLGALQQLVYEHRSFVSVAEMKQAVVNASQQLSQAFIDKSINEWRRRLECVVQQNGGHIEHLFK